MSSFSTGSSQGPLGGVASDLFVPCTWSIGIKLSEILAIVHVIPMVFYSVNVDFSGCTYEILRDYI